jgi:general L-amino acid transport system permease protein
MPRVRPVMKMGQTARRRGRSLHFRAIALQIALVGVIGALVYGAAANVAQNLARAHIASGFGFWNNTAGFDISQTLIGYSASTSSFGRAFWVGLLNTLLVAGIGIVLATMLGVATGLALLARNILLARLARGYVELVRNVPLLLQLLFWYNAVLKALPEPRDSIVLPGGALLNDRGLVLPQVHAAPGFGAVAAALLLGVAAALIFGFWARRRRERTGAQPRLVWPVLALVCGPPLVALVATGFPLRLSLPEMGRFNVRGGTEILPELAALVLALTVYTGAFIAEVVRAGVSAVPIGQTEAAHALGLRPATTLRLVVVPQALRIIIPPLTSQYLNLIKNSSLAVAIGYPDLVQVFAGSVLNITGQAVEVIAVTMAVYLAISLSTSLLMNLYARRTALVER